MVVRPGVGHLGGAVVSADPAAGRVETRLQQQLHVVLLHDFSLMAT
jgi:hypothetical protein